MDVFTKEKRHDVMSRVKSVNTKPEEAVRKFLFSQGFRYRKNDKRYPGKPDIVLPKYHTVIFVNGCFWHQHQGCRAAALPAANHEYWKEKLLRNKERDEKQIKELEASGWRVITVWECEINSKHKREERFELLLKQVTGSE